LRSYSGEAQPEFLRAFEAAISAIPEYLRSAAGSDNDDPDEVTAP